MHPEGYYLSTTLGRHEKTSTQIIFSKADLSHTNLTEVKKGWRTVSLPPCILKSNVKLEERSNLVNV